jgi:hypothetical protein
LDALDALDALFIKRWLSGNAQKSRKAEKARQFPD